LPGKIRKSSPVGGEETLARWGLHLPAGPGTLKVASLQEYLDLWSEDCAQFFSPDGEEREITFCSVQLVSALGFFPRVAYKA
jgi:hypothetical protein